MDHQRLGAQQPALQTAAGEEHSQTKTDICKSCRFFFPPGLSCFYFSSTTEHLLALPGQSFELSAHSAPGLKLCMATVRGPEELAEGRGALRSAGVAQMLPQPLTNVDRNISWARPSAEQAAGGAGLGSQSSVSEGAGQLLLFPWDLSGNGCNCWSIKPCLQGSAIAVLNSSEHTGPKQSKAPHNEAVAETPACNGLWTNGSGSVLLNEHLCQ